MTDVKFLKGTDSGNHKLTPSHPSRQSSKGSSALPLCLAVALSVTITSGVANGQPTVGLISYDEDASFAGYTLFSPFPSDTTYLIDDWGQVVHTWFHQEGSTQASYLREDGTLVKNQLISGGATGIDGGGPVPAPSASTTGMGISMGFTYFNAEHRLHHDIEPMPNGNVLMIAWERKDYAAILAAGGDTVGIENHELWPDHIIEVHQTGLNTGAIVWEWHMWDHLIQDSHPTKPNYGVVADHPELIDLGQTLSGTQRLGTYQRRRLQSGFGPNRAQFAHFQ